MVLKEVLKCISEKGYIKADEISEELGISKSLVEHVVQELKDKGYLRAATPLGVETSCSFCPLKFTCQIKTAGVVKSYVLTEKGKNVMSSGE